MKVTPRGRLHRETTRSYGYCSSRSWALKDAPAKLTKSSMYAKMLDLWADADPDLQPLEEVRSAVKRLAN